MKTLFTYLILCGVLFSLAACGGSALLVTPTTVPMISPTPIIAPAISPTPTVAIPSSPLSQSVTLSYWIKNNGRITVRVPALTGNFDPRVLKFNHEMYVLTDELIADFNGFQEEPIDLSLPEGFLDVRFELVSPPGNIFSLKFEITSYAKGAAHPFDYSRTVTYDLEKGEDVALDQLFIPGSDYLETISAYCLAKLQASEIGPVLNASGAQPDAKNYRNWNITADGLLITFDEYQVAPYAAGPQTVTIPYSKLAAIIAPQGSLAGYFSAISPVEPTAVPLEISVQEAYAKYQQSVFFLDVREQSEWDTFHIPNTTLIPLGELSGRLNELPKDQLIIVVCRSGHRSAQGRDILLNAGFTNVTSMMGGLTGWSNQGYPIEGTRP